MSQQNKSLHDIEASFSVLASNIKDYYSGNKHAYRPVAVELRKLLCDFKRNTDGSIKGADNSLLQRVFPDFRLRPLHGSQSMIDTHTILYIPGRLYFDGKGNGKISQFINENAPSLPIYEWLSQKLVDNSTTIYELIRSVADKEGAHADKDYNDTLSKTKSVKLSENWSLCDQFIIGIGRYLIKILAITMLYKDSSEVSKFIKKQYEKLGRGGAVLDLSSFAACISQGVILDYKMETDFIAVVGDDSKKAEFLNILESYQPTQVCLLLIKDINEEMWLYQTEVK